jgi:hypothetical protein
LKIDLIKNLSGVPDVLGCIIHGRLNHAILFLRASQNIL